MVAIDSFTPENQLTHVAVYSNHAIDNAIDIAKGFGCEIRVPMRDNIRDVIPKDCDHTQCSQYYKLQP